MGIPTRRLSRRTLFRGAGAGAILGSAVSLPSTTRAAGPEAGNTLTVYPGPDGIPGNRSFVVRVRTPRGKWQRVPTYLTTLKQINARTGAGELENSSMAYFDFSGKVEVTITYTKGPIEKARIRPLSYAMEPTVDGETLRFSLTEPRKVVVEVNDDVFDCLHLFANPIETDPPDADDPDVIYFGPGVHTGDELPVSSGQTVYLAGGAVLQRNVHFDNVRNAGLIGRGMIYGVEWGAILIESSKNIRVDGITILENPTGNAITVAESEQVSISNLGYFSSGQWGDGIDVYCSTDVLIDRAFLRSSDDCIAIYAHRNDYYGDVRNITVSNSTLWADVAHPINVGTHGNSENPDVLENITVHNVDILDHREPQKNYQGCIALNPGDSNLVRNVRIQSVRVEDFRWGQLVHMRVAYNDTYNTSVGRGIESVFIQDLSYEGSNAETAMMLGYDGSHGIKDVTFQNLVINGTVVADTMQKPGWYLTSDFVPMHVNEHVSKLRFLDADTVPTTAAPTITAANSTETTVGAASVYTISSTGFPTAFAADGLPDGFAVDTATGVISGTPTASGTHTVALSVTNVAGTATKNVGFTVR